MPMAAGRPVRPAPLKRLIDVVASAGGLLVLSPVMLVLWWMVRRRMGSPALFRQVRPGLHGQPFEMIKFRTMRDATAPDGRPLPDAERLTDFGRWLRATSLDELPELWNVLKGQMSLVGPRPLLMAYGPFFTPEERERQDVRPGITGYAQIMGRNTASWQSRLANDVWYARNRTVLLDFRIIFRTLAAVFAREGVSIDPRAAMLDFNVERAGQLPVLPLAEDDAAEIADLFRRCLAGPARWGTALGSDRFLDFIAGVAMPQDTFLGIRCNGALVAAVHLRRLPEALHINDIAVDESFRGSGLAQRLIRHAAEASASLPLSLDVDAANPAALRLYEGLGFKVEHETTRVVLRREATVPDTGADDTPTLSIMDDAFFRTYGIGYLTLSGREERITIVQPAHLRLPDPVPADLVSAAREFPYHSVQVSRTLADQFEGEIVSTFTTLRMTRDPSAGTRTA